MSLTVSTLLQRGADMNARDQFGHTALWFAATNHGGHVAVVRLLLGTGADPTLADSKGRTPLDWASMNDPHRNPAVVAILQAATESRQG
jgi:ankyrin repeat protein